MLEKLILGITGFIANKKVTSFKFDSINDSSEHIIIINENEVFIYYANGYCDLTIKDSHTKNLTVEEILNWLKVYFNFDKIGSHYKIDNNLELTEKEIKEIDNRLFELAQCYDNDIYDCNKDHTFTDILNLDRVMAKIHEYDSSNMKLRLSSGRELYLCFSFGD